MSQKYDEELYLLLREISPVLDEVEWIKDCLRISHEERELFLNNDIENPRFTYTPRARRDNYAEQINLFEEKLTTAKVPAVVIDLYRHKLEEQLLRNTLTIATLAADDDQFYKTSTEIYGKPKSKYFSYVSKRVLELCHEQKANYPGQTRRLRRIFSKISSDGIDVDADMLPPPVLTGTVLKTAQEVEAIFTETAARCGIEGWKVEIDGSKKKTIFAVNPFTQTILIPCDERLQARPKPLTDVHVRALAEHEVGVHVRRSYEASKGKLRLLETGLDAYLMGEEGLGGYVQQQIEGADEFYGFDRYLAACLAVGMDGEERDFRAVFSLMVDYYTLKFAADNKTKTTPLHAAWDVCVRLFRGTTGQTAGCVFTKDIVYMEGNIGIWHLLSEQPEVFESLFVGKYNPLLPRHVQTLQTLEILAE